MLPQGTAWIWYVTQRRADYEGTRLNNKVVGKRTLTVNYPDSDMSIHNWDRAYQEWGRTRCRIGILRCEYVPDTVVPPEMIESTVGYTVTPAWRLDQQPGDQASGTGAPASSSSTSNTNAAGNIPRMTAEEHRSSGGLWEGM